jgi:hypothetical protein
MMARQDNFSLQQSLEQAASFPFQPFRSGEAGLLETAVESLTSTIAKRHLADQSSVGSDFG